LCLGWLIPERFAEHDAAHLREQALAHRCVRPVMGTVAQETSASALATGTSQRIMDAGTPRTIVTLLSRPPCPSPPASAG